MVKYDKHVHVKFQENGWCDEATMAYWIKNCWKPKVADEMMLVLDVHRAQKTEHINSLLVKECNTTPVFVPPGCTSLVQPLDVSVNAPFKKRVEDFAQQHLHNNLDRYLTGKFTAGERRILLTSWVGQAWDELSSNREMVIRSLKKCGISVAGDDSEDFEMAIEGLENYTLGFSESDDKQDPFADLDISEK